MDNSVRKSEKSTIGDHRVSITILRKTYGDLIVSQHTMERWFIDEEMAVRALQAVATVFIESEEESLKNLGFVEAGQQLEKETSNGQ